MFLVKRSGPLRRTGMLGRGAPLERTGTLRRTGELVRRASIARRSSEPTQAPKPAPKRRTRKGATVDRAAIIARDGGCLGARVIPETRCAGAIHLHHVLRRSQGGPDTPENLVALCAVCHGWVHEHPALARERGLLARSGNISEESPYNT